MLLLKIIIDTLRVFASGLVLSLACSCMMVADIFTKATVWLGNAACKIRGVKCDVK